MSLENKTFCHKRRLRYCCFPNLKEIYNIRSTRMVLKDHRVTSLGKAGAFP